MTAFSGSMIDGGGSSEMLFVGFPFLERCCIVVCSPQTPLLIALTQARSAVGRRAGQAREEAELRQSTTA
ncbi:hypothetical protein T12_8590 [Trichinella patagoniensis]|uniref:Uncharacterized protein n=1 Tax=Trichinella patagoniensis TaxID=990121 RepID=A0A0V1AFB3_9BILA|nr:hypothetical protein T12_8590 [Trichinella patagoniensis]